MAFKQRMKLEDWMHFCWRWKWLMICSILVVMFIATVYCVVAKEVYRSTTTILVMPQEVLGDAVGSPESINPRERLSVIEQLVLSRSRLLHVIRTLDLFPKSRENIPHESLVKKMKERTNIILSGTRGEGTPTFAIEFMHEDPRTAMLVVSSLASTFIEDNVKIRADHAADTAEFLDGQIKLLKKDLDRQEDIIKAYKIEYIGELPEQMNSNLGLLTRYQDELSSVSDSLRAAEDRKLHLDTRIVDLKSRSGVGKAGSNDGGNMYQNQRPRRAKIIEAIAAKKAELKRTRGSTTDANPAKKILLDEIRQLEGLLSKELEKDSRNTAKLGNTIIGSDYFFPDLKGINEQIKELEKRRGEVSSNIDNLKIEKKKVSRLLESYSTRVENTPKREIELEEMMRDYTNLKLRYEELVAKKFDTDLLHDMQRAKAGEQFRILDPAYLPEEPYRPDRKGIMVLALLLSASLGIGGATLCERLDKSFKSPDEFKEIFELPVLIAIPEIMTEKERKKIARKRYILGGVLLLYLIVFLVFIVLNMEKIRVILRIG